MKRLLARWMPFLALLGGLLGVLSYWYSVRPLSVTPGYSEDYCTTDLARQLMSEQIQQFGHPAFVTDQVMTPQGASVPFESWTPERDWLGSKIWEWNPQFPFSFAYTGLSWIVTYLFLGFILSRMGRTLGFGRATAWALAMSIVVFHVPRHFKLWHHWEHLNPHWLTLSFFLDAWIWMRFQRERVWDWRLELWRGFAGVGMIQSVGTFWGPLLLEWTIVHLSILILLIARQRRGVSTAIPPLRGSGRKPRWIAGLPILLSLPLLALDLRWFPPLIAEVNKAGKVVQEPGFFAHIKFFFRPLWLDPALRMMGASPLKAIDGPETVVTVGWFYWVPAIFSLGLIRRKRGGLGWGVAAPFIVLLVIAVLYASLNSSPYFFQRFFQAVIPFMSYFRVASRWGLFLPQILSIIVILSWPELSMGWKRARASSQRVAWTVAAVLFAGLSFVEWTWLTYPVIQSPRMSQELVSLLDGIRHSPGDAVLDLPFCVAGGNGVCSAEQCPQYPASTVSECLRIWHGKKVYGFYQGRMTDADCEIYRKSPYVSWFNAWRENRCFNKSEWDGFCSYLKEHSELSAVVLYPEIWSATANPACLAEFDRRLGLPIASASVMTGESRDEKGTDPTRVLRYGTRCH